MHCKKKQLRSIPVLIELENKMLVFCISNRLKSPPSPDGKGFVSLILPCASRLVITVISIITRS